MCVSLSSFFKLDMIVCLLCAAATSASHVWPSARTPRTVETANAARLPPRAAHAASAKPTDAVSFLKSPSRAKRFGAFYFDLTFLQIFEALQIAHSSSTCSKCRTRRCIPQGQASLARPYVALNSHRPRATGKRLNIMHACA
jgi:hypothetical protein